MALRKEYSAKSPKERRRAAQWEYDSAMAEDLFLLSLPKSAKTIWKKQDWNPGVLALAIDPLFAPALLTVGSLEYQYDRTREAMDLFLTLTTLPPEEPDLPLIIDKAGDFLIDNKDYMNALTLFTAAEKSYPRIAIYYIGSGYCLSKLKRLEESIQKHRVAVELEPKNYEYLNDLGYTLYEAGMFEEAEEVLKKAQLLSPPEYELPTNNLTLIKKKKERKLTNESDGNRFFRTSNTIALLKRLTRGSSNLPISLYPSSRSCQISLKP